MSKRSSKRVAREREIRAAAILETARLETEIELDFRKAATAHPMFEVENAQHAGTATNG